MRRIAILILFAGLVPLAAPREAIASHGHSRFGIRFGLGFGPPAGPAVTLGVGFAPRTYRIWVPGRYEWRVRERYVPGRYVVVREAPVYRTVRGYAGLHRVRTSRGLTRRIWEPATTEWVRVQVWIPGHWEVRTRY